MDNQEEFYSLTLLSGDIIKGVSVKQESELTCVETPSGDCVPLGRFKLDKELMKLIKDNYEQIYT